MRYRIVVLECQIARADRSLEIQPLKSRASLQRAGDAHVLDVDLRDLVGSKRGDLRRSPIRLIDEYVPIAVVEVVAELEEGDVFGQRYRGMPARLPHQARRNDRVVDVVRNYVDSIACPRGAYHLLNAAAGRGGLIHPQRITGRKCNVKIIAALVEHIRHFAQDGRTYGARCARTQRYLELNQIAGSKPDDRVIDRLWCH